MRALVFSCLLAIPAGALEREPNEVFRERREALIAQVDGPVLLLGLGSGEGQLGRSGFRQENSFYYLSGWNEAGAAMLLLSEPYRETLFVPAPNPLSATWTGPTLDPSSDRASRETGFDEVVELEELERRLRQALKGSRRLYTLLEATEHGEPARREPGLERIRELAPGAKLRDLRAKIDKARLIKSDGELSLIEKAIEASIAGHRAAWKRIRPGAAEYQVVAVMKAAMIERGALRVAYPPIVGSGPNSVVLHYSKSTRTLGPGELVLMDVGGEYGHYAADITRTVPVDGRFSKRQRRVYEIVLACQGEVIAAAKPGMTLNGHRPRSLTQLAGDCFERHEQGLSAHFKHSIGHQVGLAVHDPNAIEELRAGMVITIEPGLYLEEEGFGVRIEDMALVTEDGVRLLTADLPKKIEDIERLTGGAADASE